MGYLLPNMRYLHGSAQDHGHLKQHILPSNVDKCLFSVDRFTLFMGIILSKKGIGPTEERGRPLQETREPTRVSKLRSFLWLANYSSTFIPCFAPITGPFQTPRLHRTLGD